MNTLVALCAVGAEKILANDDFTQELTSAIKDFKKKFVIEA